MLRFWHEGDGSSGHVDNGWSRRQKASYRVLIWGSKRKMVRLSGRGDHRYRRQLSPFLGLPSWSLWKSNREMQGIINVLLSGTGSSAICLGRVCVYLLTPVRFSIYTSHLCQTSRKLPVTSNVIFIFSFSIPSQVIKSLQGTRSEWLSFFSWPAGWLAGWCLASKRWPASLLLPLPPSPTRQLTPFGKVASRQDPSA